MNKTLCNLLIIFGCMNAHAQYNQPKLVVQLVIDQLRGDLLRQHQSQFGKDGFNYLLNNSIDFQNAHHPHANTTTCAGHATISTGSYPSMHGVVDNDWYDRDTRQSVYCMEDLKATIIPTTLTKVTLPGRSPLNLKQSTLSDEIVLSNKGRAFGVSLKDRAAITLAGHSGKAFWFDKSNGGFVSSTYYYKAYPLWVQEWNKHYTAVDYDWQLGRPLTDYQNAHNKTFKHDYAGYGQTFPHHINNPPSELYFKYLSRTPKADQLTGEFATQVLQKEHLGVTENKTDYLGVSFSAVDAIGHQFGPNSLEAEDNLLELDKTLAQLFQAIDKQVGLKNTLIILSADHGVSDSPAYLKQHQITEVEPLNVNALEKALSKVLAEQFKLPEQVLLSVLPPYIYLDHQLIQKHGMKLEKITQYLAEFLTQQPGIFRAYALPITKLEKDWLSAKVDKMAYPNRAGDLYLVPPPFQSRGGEEDNRVTHGSPWEYDSYVPLLFVNSSFKAHVIRRPVFTTDIAPTLASLLAIKAPSGAVGQPLEEVIEGYEQGQESKTS